MSNFRVPIFFGVFTVVAALYVAIMVPYSLGDTWFAAGTINLLVTTSPILLGDVNVFGEYTPPILAGLMAAAAPASTRKIPFVIAIGLAVICYLLYVHLTAFLDTPSGSSLLVIDQDNPTATKEAMTGLVASTRTF